MIWKNIKIIVLEVVTWLYKKCGLSMYHYPIVNDSIKGDDTLTNHNFYTTKLQLLILLF